MEPANHRAKTYFVPVGLLILQLVLAPLVALLAEPRPPLIALLATAALAVGQSGKTLHASAATSVAALLLCWLLRFLPWAWPEWTLLCLVADVAQVLTMGLLDLEYISEWPALVPTVLRTASLNCADQDWALAVKSALYSAAWTLQLVAETLYHQQPSAQRQLVYCFWVLQAHLLIGAVGLLLIIVMRGYVLRGAVAEEDDAVVESLPPVLPPAPVPPPALAPRRTDTKRFLSRSFADP